MNTTREAAMNAVEITTTNRRRPPWMVPAEPHEYGIVESEPDSAHAEAARVLADEAEDRLAARGFTDDEIRHWAEVYSREERSGDVETFLAWIDQREHRS